MCVCQKDPLAIGAGVTAFRSVHLFIKEDAVWRTIGRPSGMMVRMLVVWTLAGCVRTTQLGEPDSRVGDDSGTEADTDTDSDTDTDTDSDTDPPSVCLAGELSGYTLPSARWGLAALHASRRLSPRSAWTMHVHAC